FPIPLLLHRIHPIRESHLLFARGYRVFLFRFADVCMFLPRLCSFSFWPVLQSLQYMFRIHYILLLKVCNSAVNFNYFVIDPRREREFLCAIVEHFSRFWREFYCLHQVPHGKPAVQHLFKSKTCKSFILSLSCLLYSLSHCFCSVSFRLLL